MRGNRRNAGSGSDCAMGIIDDNGFTLKTLIRSVNLPKRQRLHTHCMRIRSLLPAWTWRRVEPERLHIKAVNDSEVYVSGSKHEETPYP